MARDSRQTIVVLGGSVKLGAVPETRSGVPARQYPDRTDEDDRLPPALSGGDPYVFVDPCNDQLLGECGGAR